MKNRFTKIICVAVSAISVLSVIGASGCGKYHKRTALSGDISGEISSNGGFAVEKGNYVYFINGVEENTADNEFGTPVKGGIYRISNENLNKNNYSAAECVVPSVIYSGNTNAGIFIYGDYVYYSTPSTAVDADGVVQNTALDLKRTKLDGTETPKDDQYITFTDNKTDFRFVEKGGTVYIMYVATSDKHFEEETGVTNLYSLNTKTGDSTLLAYDIQSYMFDSTDKTNPRAYYTMTVKDYYSSDNAASKYNQLYTVEADATADKFKDKINADTVLGWDKEKDHYVNCGDLVFDGIGHNDTPTVFNNAEGKVNNATYSYTLTKYQDNTLFYTRNTTNNSTKYLFAYADGTAYNPVEGNAADDERLLPDGANAGNYYYVFDGGKLKCAIIAETDGGITVNYAYTDNGKTKLHTKIDNTYSETQTYFNIVREGTATILFVDGEYLYYSIGGDSGNTVNRIKYTGKVGDYLPLPVEDKGYTSVKILDIVAKSDWYTPELLQNHLFFASETKHMTDYNYVMACDLTGESGIMSNAEIKALNELYEGIEKTIAETFGDEDKYPTDSYANLPNALRYAFYTGEAADVYLKGQQKICNAKLEESEPRVYSDKTIGLYTEFNEVKGVWAEEYSAKKTVNGKEVYANRLDYYYSVVGEMSEGDAKAYLDGLRSTYILTVEEETTTWWQGLSKAAKVWFVIGMVAAGLLVVGGIAVAVVFIVKAKRKQQPAETRRRIKVDTTDDRDIDVYSDDNGENPAE